MKKLAIQFAIIGISFFMIWGLLNKLDLMTILYVEEASSSIEKKLGEAYWEIFKIQEEEIRDKKIISLLDKLLIRLCDENAIDRDRLKLHVIKNDEVNAFTLPDGHIVVYSGLITDSENEAELCGVLAHEIAHLELGHLMKKLIKEVGLAMLISMTSANGNTDMIRQAFKVLTSSAFDRNLELEADIKAVEYLVNSNINPEGLANFLFRMSTSDRAIPDQLFWLSTHPGGEERSKDILEQMEGQSFIEERILTEEEWNTLQEDL